MAKQQPGDFHTEQQAWLASKVQSSRAEAF